MTEQNIACLSVKSGPQQPPPEAYIVLKGKPRGTEKPHDTKTAFAQAVLAQGLPCNFLRDS